MLDPSFNGITNKKNKHRMLIIYVVVVFYLRLD